jgi:hypothetical protein
VIAEAPLFFHLTDSSSAAFRNAIDQMHTVGGFDMLIYSFGSGFQLENTDPKYLAGLKADIAYARARGIEVGGCEYCTWLRTANRNAISCHFLPAHLETTQTESWMAARSQMT